jgi:hypothetical protein
MRQSSIKFVLVLLQLGATLAPAVEFKRQVITISSDPPWLTGSRLMDIDNDGLTDLLALVPLEDKLQVYRQQRSGFTTTPDQTIALPERTAWIGSYDVDAHPGEELLFSTAAGLVYLRQNDGVFEQSPRTLIETQQVFLSEYPQIMAEPAESPDANEIIPVVFVDHAVLYEKGKDYQWRPGRALDLHMTQTRWQREYLDWMAGPNRSYTVSIRTQFRSDYDPNRAQEEKAENAAIQKLIDEIRADAEWGTHGVKRQDVNGDGRQDLVLWKSRRDMSPKTTVLVFIRDRNGRLAQRPTHVLRGSGVPIYVNRKLRISPMWDLDGDGKCELILLALKTQMTSWSSLVKIVLSGGVDWIFTVRSGRDDDYSGGPDFQMEITSRTPSDRSVEWMFRIDGDFNDDGREDILLERSSDQYDVYLSDADTGFFRRGPPLSFKAPVEAWTDIADLNGDGISDLLVRERRVARITVFLSQSQKGKGARK